MTTQLSGGEREEIVNHISEFRKLIQKEHKTRHDWVGSVHPLVIVQEIKFDYTTKWYMYKPDSDQKMKC